MKVYGHTIGTCTVRDNDAFLMIPKNASTSYTSLGRIGNTENNTIKLKNFIVTLRDPFSRWISGVSEYYVRHEFEYDRIEDLERVLDKIELDEHTVPQIRFFEHLLDKKNTEFYLLENGLDKVNKKYCLWDKVPIANQSNGIGLMLQYALTWYVKANPEMGKKIKMFYKEDYEFIKKHFPEYNFKEIL